MDTTENNPRTASIVKILRDIEQQDVVLRFNEAMRAPSSKYDGHAYQTETLTKATLHATIDHASVEYPDGVLMCTALIGVDEMERVGIDPSVVWTESDGKNAAPKRCAVQIHAARSLPGPDSDLTREDVEQAVKNNRQDEVLEPWEGLLTVTIDVARTTECMKRHYESDYSVQYSSPQHEFGELIDVRVK